MSRRSACSGYTMVEVVVVLAIGTLVFSGALQAFGGGQSLVSDTRARNRAQSEHRRNLTTLANTFRGADIKLLAGFDSAGVAIQPSIQRVSGVDLTGRTHELAETIRWVPKQGTVQGVDHPGSIVSVSSAGTRLVADRVPRDTFRVRQSGSILVIECATYFRTREGKTVTLDGPVAIQLRNRE